ncbi:PIG-X [Cubamyces menziesii]|nr:PIG-X [Cubamyces menziesii]
MATLSSSTSSQGFHFTVSTTITIPDTLDISHSRLHVVYDLDPHVYADLYELAQRPGYSSFLWGTSDLEKPVSAVPSNNSVLLLTADTSRLVAPANITLDVPLHARYGRPVASRTTDAFYRITLEKPLGFLTSDLHHSIGIPEPLGSYASLAGWPSNISALISDATAADRLQVTIPVGVLDDLAWVDVGTAVVMLTMFFYLAHASLRTVKRLSRKTSTKTE